MSMTKSIASLFCLLWYTLLPLCGQNKMLSAEGKVVDQEMHPLEMIHIMIKGTTLGAVSDHDGRFVLPSVSEKSIVLVFTAVGYEKTECKVIFSEIHSPIVQVMKTELKSIQEITIENKRRNYNLQNIQSKLMEGIPAIAGGVETLIKTLPGVSSNNELSSQYSVRGGNFDENLVYVNGIEIIRPFLVKSGEQEGLSFINSDMVATIGFSAGGFDASYGDKMSSVLDITYRKPDRIAASVEIGALGASAHFEGTSAGGKFSHLTGIRYKNTSYLLGTLDKKGEYNPSFTDFQTYLNYQFNKHFSLCFLGNYTSNTYQFIPKTQLTKFGTLTNPYQFLAYYDGKEKDYFENYQGAIAAEYSPIPKLSLKFQASSFSSTEKVAYDILGEYYLNDISQQTGSQTNTDSTIVAGTGTDLSHARDKLTATVTGVDHRGTLSADHHHFQWELKFQHEMMSSHVNDWEMRDSAGYSLPYPNSNLSLYRNITGNTKIASNRYSGFIQDNRIEKIGNGVLIITGGIRVQHWGYNHQTIVSPRISASWKTGAEGNQTYRAAWGVYDQMPFFKELINPEAQLVPGVKAQRSIHYLLGYDKTITTYEQPIKFTAEIWYKALSHLIPYQLDNLNIQYLPNQESAGYATGIDFKVNGELATGAQSWASLSLMKTAENIIGDYYLKATPVGGTEKIYPGYIPRPTDQRINFSLFIQDYFPGYQTVKMSMTLFYGSGLPFGPPNGTRYMDTFRMPPYQRVDVGFSKTLIGKNRRADPIRNRYGLKDARIGFEIFNLFDINNTVSYYWISDIHNQMYAVPNYLTGRRLNLKFSIRF